jgi:hypothetical protein
MTQPPEEASTSGSSEAAAPAPNNAIAEQLRKLQLAGGKKAAKDKYQFWETQPVSQFTEDPSSTPVRRGRGPRHLACRRARPQPHLRPCVQPEDGPIDQPKTVADVRQEPYNLPDGCASPGTGAAALHAPRRSCRTREPSWSPWRWLQQRLPRCMQVRVVRGGRVPGRPRQGGGPPCWPCCSGQQALLPAAAGGAARC